MIDRDVLIFIGTCGESREVAKLLRYLSEIDQFRCIEGNPFKSDSAQYSLGKHTHIYGRNGSGKSTFSELLRQSGNDASPAKAKWHGVNAIETVVEGAKPSMFSIHVFNRWYVDENLSEFTDGSGSSQVIFKVGKEAVENKKERERIEQRLASAGIRLAELRSRTRNDQKRIDDLLDQARNAVSVELIRSNPAKYNQTKYNKSIVRKKLEAPTLMAIGDVQERAEVLATATSQDVDSLPAITALTVDFGVFRAETAELLARPIEVQAIAELAADLQLATWIETGIHLHENSDTCRFCGNSLGADLLPRLAKHFNESLLELRASLVQLDSEVATTEEKIASVAAGFPRHDQIHSSLRERWINEAEAWQIQTAALLRELERLRVLIRSRIEDPLNARMSVPLGPDQPVTTDALAQIVSEHNVAESEQEAIRSIAAAKYEDDILSAYANKFSRLSSTGPRLKKLADLITKSNARLVDRSRELEQGSKDSTLVAAELNNDLRIHFGHSHLSIELNADGDGYRIQRNSLPADNLSEGERNSITLSYFLRSLDASGVEPSSTLVVVDDPVTSLDRDVMFATHALLRTTLDRFGQSIVLTHDYEYLRLCINSLNSRWKKSQAKIRDGVANEKGFPTVQFLEITSVFTAASHARSSRIIPIPANLIDHPSEYHYLFARVRQASASSASGDLPLLANAARRLLEGFLSFRAPNLRDTQGKLNAVATSAGCPPELSGRVLRFANALSHRDEPDVHSSLEFVATDQELTAVLRFIELCDPSHFEAMVRATE